MLERRLKFHTLLFWFSLIVCLSIWQLNMASGPSLPVYFLVAVTPTTTPASPFASNALSEENASYEYPIHQLPNDDYTRLIDLHNFQFTMLSTPCNESTPILLILIHSAPQNFERRDVIRKTWGQRMDNVRLLFFFGQTSKKLQKSLNVENEKYGDCVQGNFIDSYRNLTYKHAMVFKYAIYHCPNAKYVKKTDDDVFINLVTYMDILHADGRMHGAHDLLFCPVRKRPMAHRSYRSKWRVTIREYAENYYPDMCPGWMLLYSQDVLYKLYRELQKAKYFWIDDVLVTGVLREKINVTLSNSDAWMLEQSLLHDLNRCELEARIIDKPYLYAPHDMRAADVQLVWNLTRKHVRSKNFRYAFDVRNDGNNATTAL